MAVTYKQHIQEPGLNAALLSRVGFLKAEIDFSVPANNVVNTDIIPIFEVPAGGIILGFGAKLIAKETATIADAALGVMAFDGTDYTIDADTDVAIDVDGTVGTLCSYGPTVVVNAKYSADAKTYIGIVAGGTMDEAKVLVWALIAHAPVD